MGQEGVIDSDLIHVRLGGVDEFFNTPIHVAIEQGE
jgi:hypothetical protein